MSVNSFDHTTIERIDRIANKNPDHSSFEWFVVGFLYGIQNEDKNIEDLFKEVHEISLLMKTASFTKAETDDFLIRMVNNKLKARANDKNNVSNLSKLNNLVSNEAAKKTLSQLVGEKKQNANSNSNDSKGLNGNGHAIQNKPQMGRSDTLADDISYHSDEGINGNEHRRIVKVRESTDHMIDEYGLDSATKYVHKPNDQVRIDPPKSPKALKRLSSQEELELTMAFIKKLEEEDAALKKNQAGNKQELEDNIMCNICLSSLYDEDFTPIECCPHAFHTSCLREFLKNEIEGRKFPIYCPLGKECGKEITQMDMGELLDKGLVDKYYEHSLQQYVDSHADEVFCCPTPDCKYAFAKDDDDTNFKCPICKKNYCLNCRVLFHKTMTCKEYQITNSKDENDVKFEKFVKSKKFKQCPKCQFWVEKNQGCDHMTCRCKYEFCYKCGGKYMDCDCTRKFKEQIEQRRTQIAERKKARLQANTNKKKKR